MPKLKANIRFSNAFDGKVYNEGDEFEAQDNDAAYLTKHKICNEVKEEKKPVTTKEDKTKVKLRLKNNELPGNR